MLSNLAHLHKLKPCLATQTSLFPVFLAARAPDNIHHRHGALVLGTGSSFLVVS